MSTNSGIAFVSPKLPLRNQLKDVNASPHLVNVLGGRPLPSYPPLRLSQILKMIENGSAEAVTIIEWLSVFNDDFDVLGSEQQNKACILLWKAIGENPRVAGLAMHMAANSISDKAKKFPACLIDTMSIAKEFLTGKNQLRVKWLIGLNQKNYAHCIELSIAAGCSPLRFSTTLNLPELGKFREGVIDEFVPYLESSFSPDCTKVFELCLKDMTEFEQIVTYDALVQLSDNILSHFDEIIQRRCLPDSNETLWYELSQLSRNKLKQRFQLGGYFVLKGLIDKICQKDNISYLALNEKDVRQLKSRADFWSNYSDSFNQTRILIPADTAEFIGIKEGTTSSDIIVLPNLAQEDTEVFIFELGTQIVVEVLRGPASEIRFFDMTSRNQARLLKDKRLTLRKIRTMACESIFDHVKLWQYFCERTLRENFGIHPNKNTTILNGMSKKRGSYERDEGLIRPSDSDVTERAEQLELWNNIFWIREAKVKNLQPDALLANGWKEMQLAELAKLQGKLEEFETLLDKAANYKNSAAMCLKAVSIFTSKHPTYNQWKEAEELVAAAIYSGYEPGKTLVEKYNLKIEKTASHLKHEQLSRRNKVAKSKEKIPTTIFNNISEGSERPYIQLKVEELEILADNISDKNMKDALIWELSFRRTNKRNTALLNRLKFT